MTPHSPFPSRARSAALLLTPRGIVVRAQAPQPAPGGDAVLAEAAACNNEPGVAKPPQTVTPQAHLLICAARADAVCRNLRPCVAATPWAARRPEPTRSTSWPRTKRGDDHPARIPGVSTKACCRRIFPTRTSRPSWPSFTTRKPRPIERGNRRTVDVADLQTGNARPASSINGAGGCSKCHSRLAISRDLPTARRPAALSTRLSGRATRRRRVDAGGYDPVTFGETIVATLSRSAFEAGDYRRG